MALKYGISYGLLDEASDETKRLSELRFKRLSEAEAEFYHSDPFLRMGLLHLMMTTDIRTIVKSSVPVLFDRYCKVDPFTMVSLVQWICRAGLRDFDPPEIRDTAAKFLADPNGRMMRRDVIRTIFCHWILDRFAGVSTNIGTKTDAEYARRLKDMEPRDADPVLAKTYTIWARERTELFESWAKEPVIV